MKRFIRHRILIIVLIILASAGFYFYTQSTQSAAAGQKSYKVKRQTLKEELTLSGQIDATERTALRFQSSGMLTWVGVKEGDYVQKGQAIASLDQRELRNRMNKYLASYTKTRTDFDQQQDENRESVLWSLTEEQRREAIRAADKAQQDLNSSVLDVELQALTLQYSSLTSPIEGIVVRVPTAAAGSNITPATAEFEIVNPNTLYFTVLADQTEVTQLRFGQNADLAFDAYLDNADRGTISYIAYMPKAGETGTVYEVRLSFNQYAAQYRLGMTGDATFVLKEKQNALAIPLNFIKTEQGKKYVLRKEGDQNKKAFIQTGDVFDATVEVTSGLQAGDVIYD